MSRLWTSICSVFKITNKNDATVTELRREERLTNAFQAVFLPRRRADDEDKEIVLAHLQSLAGLYGARSATDTSTEQLWQDEGRRQMMTEIHDRIFLPEADLRALEQAARREAALSELDEIESQQGHDLS